jgi:hypothetical protein
MNEYDEIHGADDAAYKGKPHGWIQWKGTDVCIDIYCECGDHGHVDDEFFYHYQCHACGRRYEVGCNVALIPLRDDQRTDSIFITDTTGRDDMGKGEGQ